ncbi:hypothetical protein H8M03_12055 [Sphingomonas sabuli]|uniref:Potassium channel domain-containing protein n=1 Tax=Sphingomonas sabuli TaxID=2764186 RepID=A0A7G9L261_9SPHN|nr:ion channel [Sphingomonas sabuli]QNM82710.1 hypothetical protein H8M03_12055 [Sphingomonas sabuli]
MNVVNTVAHSVDETTVNLGLQLSLTGGLVLVMVMIHSLGLVGIGKLLHLQDKKLEERDFNVWAILLMARLGFSVFVLHLFEIAVFAFFYLKVVGLDSVEEALFFSASTYSTLGATSDYFPHDWRLMGAVEGLIGFILIGWSTAFMVSTMRKLSESPHRK